MHTKDCGTPPRETAIQYLMDELALLDLRLARETERRRAGSGEEADTRALFVTAEEVASTLGSMPGAGGPGTPGTEYLDGLIAKLESEISAPGGEAGQSSLGRLAEIFRLSPREVAAFVMAAAPDLDARYERVFAYLNDDLTQKRPTVKLALALLFDNPSARLHGLDIFSPGSPLLRFSLIRPASEGGAFAAD